MINLGQIKKTRFLIMVVIIFTMLWVFAVGNVLSNFKTEQQNLLNEERKDIQSRIDSTIATYDSFTNYIFDDLLLHSEVTELLYQASFSDESQKLDYRESLHEMLISEYDLLEEHNFRQFHFHLPDGESFLRFHSPSDYGDHLFDVRETVRLANTQLKKVVGFEEGRIFSGYRFVFPLFHDEKHVGSVEISVDLNTILNLLEKRNPEISAIYILEKEVVSGKVFDVHLDNYVPAFNLDDFFMDKSQIEKMHLDSDRYAQINNPMV
ncbi:cache domain-containing protein, partial [Jeotgalibaca porci]|uniref:cache domain-containing protein n=1 Tax=Jeotgalibaca porci TaxID=1868793 RepID=UPI0035A17EE9